MNNKFFMLPKEIMNKKLSDGGKLLYTLMLDRSSLSSQNGWRDDEGKIYIYFTTKEIKETFGWGEQKVIKILGELEREGLIEKKRQGLGKPSKIYVNDLSEEASKSQLQNYENQSCETVIITNQEFPKSQSNNTDNNNTDKSYTENKSYLSENDAMGWKLRHKSFKNLIREHINYKAVTKRFGKVWCDEIVEIMADVLMTKKPYIKINGEDYPAEAVKSRFMKINDMHIEYINMALTECKSQIKNIRSFLITSIYRAPETIENYYSAKVNVHT